VHPDVEPLAFLLGTWTGEGRGEYPTIEGFAYREEIRFTHNGKPFVGYVQRTWAVDDGRPLHGESGYLRPVGPAGELEYVLVHPTGLGEIGGGRVAGQHVTLGARATRTPTALAVERVEREIEVVGDVLRYELRMSMETVPLTRHLVAELRRTEDA
jgi:hypothetical protein